MLGQVITQYDEQGVRYKSFVYSGESLVASATTSLTWRHSNPITGDGRETDAQGKLTSASFVDPAGVNVGATDPEAGNGEPLPPDPLLQAGAYAAYLPRYLGGSGRCRLNGIQWGCGLIRFLHQSGIVSQAPELAFTTRRWVQPGLILRLPSNPFDDFRTDETVRVNTALLDRDEGHWESTSWFWSEGVLSPEIFQSQTPCERKLAAMFGGKNGIMRTRYDYLGNYRGRDPEFAEIVRGKTSEMGTPYFEAEHLFNFPHLSGNFAGTANTDVFFPKGFDRKTVTGPTPRDAVVTMYNRNLDVTVAAFHVKDFRITVTREGSIRVGTTGGRGADSSNKDPTKPNLHSHFEAWRGRTGFLEGGADRNAARIPFV